MAWPTWCSTDIQRGAQQNSPAVVSYYTHTIRPFLTRNFFQEILGLEGSKNFLEKNRQVHNLMISDRLLRSKSFFKKIFLVLYAAYFVVREEGMGSGGKTLMEE